MRILQVTTSDYGGGAEKVANNLFHAYRALGHDSRMAVGLKYGSDPDVSDLRSTWFRIWWSRRAAWIGSRPLRIAATQMALLPSRPSRVMQVYLGMETVFSRHSWTLLDAAPPDILHLHNLHGGYFDLRALPFLSQRVPTFVTLHDAWLLAGHCAHSFDCMRWQTGCGHCPYLDTYPATKRDATAGNWQRKRRIYAHSRLYVNTPSRWLMDKVDQSMLAPGIVQRRVIPNSVDTELYNPGDPRSARAALGLPQDATIVLFAANGIRKNPFKDYATLRSAIEQLGHSQTRLLLIALGEDAPAEHLGSAEIRFVPFQSDPRRVAEYYRAADLYLHCARADTFPNTVLEALACGLPVIGSAVGGIPEQIIHEQTGLLVEPGNAAAVANAVTSLLSEPERMQAMRLAAAADAQRRFTLRQQSEALLAWYEEARQEHLAGQASGIR